MEGEDALHLRGGTSVKIIDGFHIGQQGFLITAPYRDCKPGMPIIAPVYLHNGPMIDAPSEIFEPVIEQSAPDNDESKIQKYQT